MINYKTLYKYNLNSSNSMQMITTLGSRPQILAIFTELMLCEIQQALLTTIINNEYCYYNYSDKNLSETGRWAYIYIWWVWGFERRSHPTRLSCNQTNVSPSPPSPLLLFCLVCVYYSPTVSIFFGLIIFCCYFGVQAAESGIGIIL